MIFDYIDYLEDIARKDLARGLRNLSALENIKELLGKVDHQSEEIPLSSEQKLLELLTSLKEESLTAAEREMVSMIIYIKNSKSQ